VGPSDRRGSFASVEPNDVPENDALTAEEEQQFCEQMAADPQLDYVGQELANTRPVGRFPADLNSIYTPMLMNCCVAQSFLVPMGTKLTER
jgi:hypothetical protein